jgi:hypothetical protein
MLLRDTSIDEQPNIITPDHSQHLESSLPGTPMDSDGSYDLSASVNSSVLFNSSKGSLVIATRAQVTTPSNVNLNSQTPSTSSFEPGVSDEKL